MLNLTRDLPLVVILLHFKEGEIMMNQILVYTDNSIFDIGKIEKGTFGGKEELYRVTDENGVEHYAVTNGYSVYEVESIPEDFSTIKYCYNVQNGFYINPNYVDPESNIEKAKSLITKFYEDEKITEEDFNSVMELI